VHLPLPLLRRADPDAIMPYADADAAIHYLDPFSVDVNLAFSRP
jgi:hypothetical protein